MLIYKPYTYLIGWSKLNKWYYGCSYKQKTKPANPDQLWTSYFTSSKIVKNYRKIYGEPDAVEVRKVFDTADSALSWESKVIFRMKLVEDNRFLNQKDTSDNFRNKGGYKLSDTIKSKMKNSFTDERRKFLSELATKTNKKCPLKAEKSWC